MVGTGLPRFTCKNGCGGGSGDLMKMTGWQGRPSASAPGSNFPPFLITLEVGQSLLPSLVLSSCPSYFLFLLEVDPVNPARRSGAAL